MTTAKAGDTREEIMEATRRALATHGHAELTIQAIADEFPKSKALLYYHYDTKEAILVDFIEFLLEGFRDEVEADLSFDDPKASLESLVDQLLPTDFSAVEVEGIRLAILEFQVHAPHDTAYRERFTELYAAVEETTAALVRAGIEEGAFREVDPDEEARRIVSMATGGILRTFTTDLEPPTVRDSLDTYLEQSLYA